MNDPTQNLISRLVTAEKAEPVTSDESPQRTKQALLFREVVDHFNILRARLAELLSANTRYLLRARTSEELLFKLYETHTMNVKPSEQLLEDINNHIISGPWNIGQY